jgi:hypothetical protein
MPLRWLERYDSGSALMFLMIKPSALTFATCSSNSIAETAKRTGYFILEEEWLKKE